MFTILSRYAERIRPSLTIFHHSDRSITQDGQDPDGAVINFGPIIVILTPIVNQDNPGVSNNQLRSVAQSWLLQYAG